MRRIDRKDLQAPARVLDLDLSAGGDAHEAIIPVGHYNSVWCLSRIDSIPQEISFWDVSGDRALSIRELCDHLHPSMSRNKHVIQGKSDREIVGPDLTVVICTRNRPAGLRAALASLQDQSDSKFRTVVVDNGSSSQESAEVVDEVGLPDCEYVIEPRPGLSRARNRGLKAVATELVAWMDDDEIADRDWVRRLKEGFSHEENPVAVCGVMLPAELEYEAQVRFEQYGGFNKGRGMAPEILRMGSPSVISPLYPLPSFGPGGNMAFRSESLRAVGGFDPCLGAGTLTHGCEEMRALSLQLSAGHTVLHWPAAITWHTHRRELAALKKQLYGYSAGVSAFYASMIRSKPGVVLEILRLVPYAVRDLREGKENQRSGHLPEDFPADLLRAARRGLLEGALMYACEVVKDRRQGLSTATDGARTKGAVSGATHA